MIAGSAVELAICVYWIIAALSIDETLGIDSDIAVDFMNATKGVLVGFAIFFAIMPTISLILSLGQTTTQFLQSRRGH
jgi:predicted Na+-dependent transporter